jgi:RNA polymerase sigma-70 factor, ECF subfamily
VDDENDSAEVADLIQRIGMGDRASFVEFFTRFSRLVYSTAFKVVGSEADAQDIMQDVFFMIWEKAPRYDPERGKPLTWALTITRNKAIDKLRSLQRRSRLHDAAQNENEVGEQQVTFDQLDSVERGQIVLNAVMKLNKEQREAIELAYFKGLTQQEIAVQLHQPLGTVKARIRRGVLRLKKIIGRPL